MAKADVVAAQLALVQAAEVQALTDSLGACFDSGEADGNGPGFTQADIDAAVASAVAPLNAQVAQDATDLAAAHADADAKLAALQASLDDMTAKDLVDASAVQGFNDKVAALQGALDAIKALLLPVVPPAP